MEKDKIICPHCNKELTLPLFRFCNYCNGNIKSIMATSVKKEKERRNDREKEDMDAIKVEDEKETRERENR
ncbi:MAG: hypothetical protein ACTSRE_17295 [Promethearchaeota archaeon]